MAKDIDLRPGSAVEVAIADGALVVKPAKKRKASLSQLLKGVTKENRHDAHDWGAPAGREIW